MDFKDYLKIFRSRRRVIVISAAVIFLNYLFLVLRKPPVYFARSSVLVTRPPSYSDRVSLSVTSVVPAVMPIENQLQLLKTKNIGVQVANTIRKKYPVSSITAEEVMAATQTEVVGNSSLIHITARSSDPVKAVAISGEFARLAVRENERLAKEEFISGKRFTETQLRKYQKKMKKIEGDIRAFNEKYGVVDFDEALSQRLDRLSDYASEIEKSRMELRAADALVLSLEKKLNITPEFKTAYRLVPNPEKEALKKKLAEEQTKLYALEDWYTPAHPKVRSALETIEGVKKRLRETFEEEMGGSEAGFSVAGPILKSKQSDFVREKAAVENPLHAQYASELATQEMNKIVYEVKASVLSGLMQREQDELRGFSAAQVDYARYVRELKAAQDILTQLTQSYEQMRIHEASKLGNLKVVDIPKTSQVSGKFDFTQLMFIVFLSAFCAGAIGVVVELLDDTVKTSYEIKRYLNLPVMGIIPKVQESADVLLLKSGLKTALSEVYHKVCFHLQSACLETGAKTLMVVSSRAQEGKTSVLINLAVSLVREGEKVLIVDTDLRRPSLHSIFGESNTVGLSSLLTGDLEAEVRIAKFTGRLGDEQHPFSTVAGEIGDMDTSRLLDHIIKPTGVPNLFLLTSGPIIPNPVELLRSEKLANIVKLLRQKADFVLFDTPPLIAVIDAPIIGANTDGCVLVVNGTLTKRRDAIHAKQLLSSSPKINIMGVILNSVPEETHEYYYYYSYGTYGASSRKKGRKI